MELTRIHQLARALDYSEFETEVMKEQAAEQLETEASDICHSITDSILLPKDSYKAKMVVDYLDNLDKYRVNGYGYWDVFKIRVLNGRSEPFINTINVMIDEYVDNGEAAFKEKYGI